MYLGGDYPRQKYDVADNEEYDPATGRWRSRAPVPSGLNHVAATALHGKIYIVGGFTGNGHKGVSARVLETTLRVTHGGPWRHSQARPAAITSLVRRVFESERN